MSRSKGDSGKSAKAARQDRARDQKARAAEKREADRKAGQREDERIRQDQHRRHPW